MLTTEWKRYIFMSERNCGKWQWRHFGFQNEYLLSVFFEIRVLRLYGCQVNHWSAWLRGQASTWPNTDTLKTYITRASNPHGQTRNDTIYSNLTSRGKMDSWSTWEIKTLEQIWRKYRAYKYDKLFFFFFWGGCRRRGGTFKWLSMGWAKIKFTFIVGDIWR